MPHEAQQARDEPAQNEDLGGVQVDTLRAQAVEAMPRALASGNPEARAAFVAQLERVAEQAAEGEAPGSPWLALAMFLRACAALLRGEPIADEGLLPEDRALLERWRRGEADAQAPEENISLEDAIRAWAAGDEEDPEARHAALVELLNYCADAAVQVLRDGDREAAEALADLMVPLRVALLRWLHAAALPPYNALLGCLQALLRGEEVQLARLRARLDERLAETLRQIEALVRGDEQPPAAEARADHAAPQQTNPDRPPAEAVPGSEPDLPEAVAAAIEMGDVAALQRALAELPEEERERTLAALRRRTEAQIAQMSPEELQALALQLQLEQIERAAAEVQQLAAETLTAGDPDARRRLAIQVGKLAAQYALGEAPGSPADQLAAFLRGVAAVLRGTIVPPVPPHYAERIAALRAIADSDERP